MEREGGKLFFPEMAFSNNEQCECDSFMSGSGSATNVMDGSWNVGGSWWVGSPESKNSKALPCSLNDCL